MPRRAVHLSGRAVTVGGVRRLAEEVERRVVGRDPLDHPGQLLGAPDDGPRFVVDARLEDAEDAVRGEHRDEAGGVASIDRGGVATGQPAQGAFVLDAESGLGHRRRQSTLAPDAKRSWLWRMTSRSVPLRM